MAKAVSSQSEKGKSAERGFFGRILWFLRKNLKWIALAIVILAVTLLAYGYINTRNQLAELSNPKKANQNQTQELVSEISKYAQLPTGETPTVATVQDVSKLKGQPFFAGAQNGDKVLIYTKANKAVLYRPSTNKILQYSTINLNSNQ